MKPERRLPAPSRARGPRWPPGSKADRDKNIAAGKVAGERTGQAQPHPIQVDKVVLERFRGAEELEDLLAGIGSGDIRINQLLNYLDTRYNKPDGGRRRSPSAGEAEQKANVPFRPKPKDHRGGRGGQPDDSHRPLLPAHPGDAIQDSTTMGRGFPSTGKIASSSRSCRVANPSVDRCGLGGNYSGSYGLTIRIPSNDRSVLLRDITTVLANEKINAMGGVALQRARKQTAEIDMELRFYKHQRLQTGRLASLSQFNDVISAKWLWCQPTGPQWPVCIFLPCRALKTISRVHLRPPWRPDHVEQWRERIFMNPFTESKVSAHVPTLRPSQLLDIMARLRPERGLSLGIQAELPRP